MTWRNPAQNPGETSAFLLQNLFISVSRPYNTFSMLLLAASSGHLPSNTFDASVNESKPLNQLWDPHGHYLRFRLRLKFRSLFSLRVLTVQISTKSRAWIWSWEFNNSVDIFSILISKFLRLPYYLCLEANYSIFNLPCVLHVSLAYASWVYFSSNTENIFTASVTAVAVTEAFLHRMHALTKNLEVRFLPAVYQQAQILTSVRRKLTPK
jgi:hypothetical protein